jgi:hypothetical protein
MRYRTVASDGDTVQGEIRFTYEGATTAAPPGWRPPTDAPSIKPAAAGKSAPDGRGPWPWLVPVLLAVAVAGAVALARAERSRR